MNHVEDKREPVLLPLVPPAVLDSQRLNDLTQTNLEVLSPKE
jgi:hypothetical protein